MSSNLPISARVRPNSEAAPWVIDEVRDLEARADRLAGALREVIEAIEFTPLGVRAIKALEAARAALEWRTPKTEGIAK